MKTEKINGGLAMNPFLPGKEYIPDGEPHVFGDRVYVYGSHDRFGGNGYCQEPYVAWSAPVQDLNDWRYEGVILEKGQDPLDPEGTKSYYAPDAAQGPDGRYYLYYSIEDSSVISVAVCDSPAGAYRFYGHVKDPSGHVLGSSEEDPFQFDPAVLVSDGRIYLYSGQNIPVPGVEEGRNIGCMVCELESDMLTAKTEQKVLTSGSQNCLEKNPFFEASSIRKFQGRYYLIYSPLPNVHNLCYAVSDRPDGGFRYGGVLVSNADIFAGEEHAQTMNYWGNNHGSVAEINGEYYVFYHRHTNRSGWCRQACSEKIRMSGDGSFTQARLTSGGISGNAIPAKGAYGCYTACHLRKKNMTEYQPFQFQEYDEEDPYFTQEEETKFPYIANFCDGTNADYRYFHFQGDEKEIQITCRGNGEGALLVYDMGGLQEPDAGQKNQAEPKIASKIAVRSSEMWETFCGELKPVCGNRALRVLFQGTGSLDLLQFQIR